MESKITQALELLPAPAASAVRAFGALEDIDEIRLRSHRPLTLSIGRRDAVLDYKTEAEDIESVFRSAFNYSLHTHQRELLNGSVTVRGGCRVGICGTAVTGAGGVESVKYISSVNIRIAREIKGCADEVINTCFKSGPKGLLVIGPPASGKTTLLRDISRQLGSRFRISLIDERGEISAASGSIPQNDVGILTDVFFSYPKAEGIETAVRVMSPLAVIVDEIGSERDLKALEFALHSGVSIISAVHAENLEDALKKPIIKSLYDCGAFSYAAVLNHERKAEVEKIV